MDVHLADGSVKRFVVGGSHSGYRFTAVTFKSDDVRKMLEMDDQMLRFWLESLRMRFDPREVDYVD